MALVVFGSINLDLVVNLERFPRPGETLRAIGLTRGVGGKGANQAVAAARAGGASVRLVGRVGDDEAGGLISARLGEETLELSGLERVAGAPSGHAFIEVVASGENRIVIVAGANARLGAAEGAALGASLSPADVLLLQLEIPMAANLAAARAARERGARVVLDPAPAPDVPVAELLGLASWLTPNESEAAALLRSEEEALAGEAPERILARLEHRVPEGRVALKRGAKGALASAARGESAPLVVPPYEVEVVDSVAAGDAFNGALAAALDAGLSNEAALERAAAAGALATTRRGALDAMPRAEEIDALVARGRPRPSRERG